LTEFPKEASFAFSWRGYQQRVLDELDSHLADGHLHIVAPPGSGKTVLGIEVALRLNRPTLILAPTLAIRNQWILRFCELFLNTQTVPEWISRDIRAPRFLTVVTYQGLHAACNGFAAEVEESEEEEQEEVNGVPTNERLDEVVRGLLDQGVKTVVVDEAHHLKNEWWQTLTAVKSRIEPVIVGLTATPPYDVSAAEWQRYIELNGPVDAEIAVPELVLAGDLCPHQDYVYLTLPSAVEHERLIKFRQGIETLFSELRSDPIIAEAVETHPMWLDPEAHLEWIYSNLPIYSAILIFLHSNGKEIPELHLEVIGDKRLEIPPFDFEWAETLLQFYLFNGNEHFGKYEAHRESLENRLRRYGALERRQVSLSHNRRLTGLLTSSISKLDAVQNIAVREYASLDDRLRMVILTDYIRKEYFVNTSENELDLNRIGVFPIFEKLRRKNDSGMRLGVLTGSVVILPTSACEAFRQHAQGFGISEVTFVPVPYDSGYVSVIATEALRNEMVHIVTEVFQKGGIEVLIGTKSLLGEGWDAPAINSLVLASFVGSFVLSNQMRGRAIRTINGDKDKTANIWHLACIDPTDASGGDDLVLLQRRFRAFVGVSVCDSPRIENGLGRLSIPHGLRTIGEVDMQNTATFGSANDRDTLKERWHLALKDGTRLVEEIRLPFSKERDYEAEKSMQLKQTIAAMISTLVFGITCFIEGVAESAARMARHMKGPDDWYAFLAIAALFGVVFFGGLTVRTAILYIRYRDISKDLEPIANALLAALCRSKAIVTSEEELSVDCSMDEEGAVYCHMEGGTTFERSLFINALQEVVGLVGNPRYIIIRKSRSLLFTQQRDYHAVPEILGRRKEFAEYFEDRWIHLVGKCELVFTRNIEGRKMLLRSRLEALSSHFEVDVEHVNKWR
jgi:hypothetical protein